MTVEKNSVPAETQKVDGRKAGPTDGGRRLTKTQQSLLRYIAGETAVRGGAVCSKRELARMLGRNVKTIDRCLAGLRDEGLVEVEMRFDESGAQISSEYRAVIGPPA